jgi:Dyp-type peroxidase family
MAYRKLHQNVASFTAYTLAQATALQANSGLDTLEAAHETIMAKMVGRWRSGIPLEIAPDYAQAKALESQWSDVINLNGKPTSQAEAARLAAYEKLIMDFRYRDDAIGARCPMTAHIRRVNPRDALSPLPAAPDTALTNRRRLLRRGAPYGDSTTQDDTGEHGVIFMALCASLFNQFEFVQQQWVHYGASFGAGNDTDPLTGLRRPGAKFVIPAEPGQSTPPFFCANIPQFVETRGGEYFLLPSLTALRQIAQGSVDPT